MAALWVFGSAAALASLPSLTALAILSVVVIVVSALAISVAVVVPITVTITVVVVALAALTPFVAGCGVVFLRHGNKSLLVVCGAPAGGDGSRCVWPSC